MAEVDVRFPLGARKFGGGGGLTPDQVTSLVDYLNDLGAHCIRQKKLDFTAEKVLVVEASPANGGMISIANPEGVDLFIEEVILDVTTEVTGTATADIGVAADGVTKSDTLLDGVDIGTAAGVFNNVDDQGTNGKVVQKWAAGEYVTGTADTDSTGLVGKIYIKYRKVVAL